MENTLCFECGKPASVQHHVIPQSLGGIKTVPLCNDCHSLVHNAKLISSGELIKNGRKRSRECREEVLNLYKRGISKRQIAKEMNISRETVYNILSRNGLHKNEGKGLKEIITPEVIARIKALRLKRKNWKYIEKEIGISYVHLFRTINNYDLFDKCYNTNLINRSTYRTLTDEQILKAKELRKQKLTWQQIADIIGVERSTLYRHKFPKRFKSLRGSLTPDKKEMAKNLRQEGKTWKEIANILGVSKNTLYWNKVHK